MRLLPREIDKLVLHQAGALAQKRLARGVRLNYPESVALIATQLLELIRDGRGVAELMDIGRTILGRYQVMDGVPDLVAEVQVEGTFPDGTKLVTVHHPIVADHGDLVLALYGSFLPVPDRTVFREVPVPPAIACGSVIQGSSPRSSVTSTSTATSASSAAARCCAIAWASSPARTTARRSTS